MGKPSPRAVANKGVPTEAYLEAIHGWLSQPPITSIEVKCGPKLAFNFRQVTPAMISAVIPLLNGLLASGLDTMVVQIAKLEYALKNYLSKNAICRGDGPCIDTLVHTIATHLQTVMSVVRYIKREEDQPMSGFRSFPRSGGIRKRMTLEEWEALKPVLRAMSVPQALG